MIKINLQKKPAVHKKVEKKPFPVKKVIVTVLVIVLIAGLGGGAYYYFELMPVKTVSKAPQTPAPKYNPLPQVKSNIVEEVVKEVNESQAHSGAGGVLDIPYQEMSFGEKISYEVYFGKKVFELIIRSFSNAKLKSLEISNFQTIYAVGLGDTREIVSSTFTSLRDGKVEILPQPYSYIKSNGGKEYRFVVTCKADFGLDLTDPFKPLDNLQPRDDLQKVLKDVNIMATQDGLNIRNKPELVSSEKVGVYSRFVYRISGSGSYVNFVKFVMDLYKKNLVCAFKKVEIKALGDGTVGVIAELLFTMRE
jgi:hypothetical protein